MSWIVICCHICLSFLLALYVQHGTSQPPVPLCFDTASFLLTGLFLIFSCLCDSLLSKPSPILPLAVKEPLPIPLEQIFLFHGGLQFEAVSCNFFVQLSFLNHVVQGRFVFFLLIRSLPASLTFSSSFASFCLPIPTPSTSCSVYTLREELFQTASSLGRTLQVPLEQGLFLLCPKSVNKSAVFLSF